MAVLLQNAGANWSNSNAGLLIPFTLNCLGWFYPSTAGMVAGSTILVKDYSSQNKPATLSGGPTINAGYVSFGEPATLQFGQTQILDPTTDITIIATARSSDTQSSNATTADWVTNYGNDSGDSISGAKGVSLAVGNTAQFQGTDFYNNSGAAGVAHANLTETTGFYSAFRMYAFTVATVAGVTTRTAYDLTGGTFATATQTGPRAPNLSNQFRFGGSLGQTNGGQGDVAHVAFFNKSLTLQQLNTLVRPMIVANLATKGVTGL